MYRALKSFSGKISVAEGERIQLFDEKIINDLLQAGYIAKIEETKKETKGKKTKRKTKTK